MGTPKFVTAINCMDGRAQLPVINYIKNKYDVDYVDMITEPGAVKIFAEKNIYYRLIENIIEKIKISIDKHNSQHIFIVAHSDCAGNPISKEVQIKQLKNSISIIESMFKRINISGLWIDENWDVHSIK